MDAPVSACGPRYVPSSVHDQGAVTTSGTGYFGATKEMCDKCPFGAICVEKPWYVALPVLCLPSCEYA